MNVKLKVLRKVLEEAIANIDAGNSNHSDDELDDIISSLTKLNRGIKRISKREACERILHCSPSTFDNYIKLGLIPRGHKEYGFKELNRLQTYLLTNLIINLMVLVDKENVKGYVQMDEKEHTKKEYASKGLAGTALGLGIGGLAVSLLNNGCNPLGIFGRNCGTNAGEVAIAANEQYLERKQCADFVELVNGMW